MIISKLKGGLGNQMFQYAAGLALAKRQETSFKTDLSQLKGTANTLDYTKRDYELKVFSIAENFANENEINLFIGNRNSVLYKIKNRYLPYLIKNKYYNEPSLKFDDSIFTLGKNLYLDGYFQSEKYFANEIELINNNFSFKKDPFGLNLETGNKIKNENSISLHVRRNDYLSSVNQNLFGNICTIEYYNKAVSFLKSKVNNPVFYIFSDDISWAEENIKTDCESHFINNNTGENSFEDMRLMSLSKHNIIANSSFSWWGAWLNANPKKIVVAPSKWLNDPNCITADIIPTTWVKI